MHPVSRDGHEASGRRVTVQPLERDAPVLERARQAAEALLAQDPDLDAPPHRALASEVRRRFAERLALVRP